MTISSSANKTIALGNGSATQFAFGFIGVAAAYISVIYTDASGNETTLTHGSGSSQYQITLNSAPQGGLWGIGGTVTYNPGGTPIATGTTLTIARELPLTQAINLQNQISLAELGNGAETGLDTLEMQIQQVYEQTARAIVAPIVDPSTINLTLPPAAQRANYLLGFDSLGNVIAATSLGGATVSSAMVPVVEASTLALARTAMGLGAMATEGIGSGLSDDGAGNARLNFPIEQVSTSQNVTSGFNLQQYVATGPINFYLPRANTLWNGFGFWLTAVTGDITLVPNAADQINGTLAAGSNFTVPAGCSQVFISTDAASSGNWYVNGIPWLVQNARSISGAYTISATDNFKILNHNSGAFGSITFPAGSSLPANFRCLIINGESSMIGKGVGGTNLSAFTMYPSQSYLVINKNNTMWVVGGRQPYEVTNLTLFADANYGSDNPMVADGLASGTRAFLTQNNMQDRMYDDFLHNFSSPVCTCNGTFTENITFRAAPPGAVVVFWNGSSPGAYTINQVSGVCWIVGDGAVMECTNVHWEGGNVTSTAIQMHQTAILDILSGCTFGNMGGSGTHISTDGAGWTVNIDAGYTIENGGSASHHWGANGGGVYNVTGSITITINGGPAPSMTYWAFMSGPALINMGSSVTFSGGPATGCQQWAVQEQSWLARGGNTIPGSVNGNPTAGSAPTGVAGWVS